MSIIHDVISTSTAKGILRSIGVFDPTPDDVVRCTLRLKLDQMTKRKLAVVRVLSIVADSYFEGAENEEPVGVSEVLEEEEKG